jgi:hypothetical protein
MACTKTAAATTINKVLSISVSLFTITSSIKNLLAPGNTKLAIRLITISTKPSPTMFFRGQINDLKAWYKVTFCFLSFDISISLYVYKVQVYRSFICFMGERRKKNNRFFNFLSSVVHSSSESTNTFAQIMANEKPATGTKTMMDA